jgi:hypothetical protein
LGCTSPMPILGGHPWQVTCVETTTLNNKAQALEHGVHPPTAIHWQYPQVMVHLEVKQPEGVRVLQLVGWKADVDKHPFFQALSRREFNM